MVTPVPLPRIAEPYFRPWEIPASAGTAARRRRIERTEIARPTTSAAPMKPNTNSFDTSSNFAPDASSTTTRIGRMM